MQQFAIITCTFRLLDPRKVCEVLEDQDEDDIIKLLPEINSGYMKDDDCMFLTVIGGAYYFYHNNSCFKCDEHFKILEKK